jgi:hypothetical protein
MKEHAIEFLKWVTANSVVRNTSRNNIWSRYWQLLGTGVLYSIDELYDYWIKINK